MQPIRVTQALRRARRRYQPTSAVALDQILDDRARFGDSEPVLGNHRRFAERMHRPQRRWRKHGLRVSLVAPNLVTDAEFFQQPQHALRTRVIEVVNRDHRHLSAQRDAILAKVILSCQVWPRDMSPEFRGYHFWE